MKALPVLQVDAFAETVFGGNPCAVVFDADDLSTGTMQKIARELNLPETAFVLESDRADFGARYFTPGEEVPLAGHPTIATVYGLLATQRLRRQGHWQRITLELPAGVIDVDITGQDGESPLIKMTQMRPEFLREYDRQEVADAFSLDPGDFVPDMPILTVSTGTPQLMLPLRSLDVLRQARVDNDLYARLREFGDFFSAHLFVREGVTPEGDTFARHFGVPPDWREDAFTGSATGAMAAYMWRYGLIRKWQFTAEQGHWLGRPGRAEVEVSGDRESVDAVRVGGRAVEVMEGMFVVPD